MLFLALWNAIRFGWTDPDWGCRASLWWLLRHKTFGRKFFMEIVGNEIHRRDQHFAIGFVGFGSILRPDIAPCLFCDLRGFTDEILTIPPHRLLGVTGKLVPANTCIDPRNTKRKDKDKR